MKKDVRYIAETKEFIVDGKVIKESSLTPQERQALMANAKPNTLITGEQFATPGTLLV
jgi:hypothetical protein